MSELSDFRAELIATIKANKTHDVTIVKVTEAAPVDATKPWRVGAGTPVSYTCAAIVSDVAMKTDNAEGESDKNVIIPGDVAFAPDSSMRLTLNSKTYEIKATQNYNVENLDVGFKLRICQWPSTSSARQT